MESHFDLYAQNVKQLIAGDLPDGCGNLKIILRLLQTLLLAFKKRKIPSCERKHVYSNPRVSTNDPENVRSPFKLFGSLVDTSNWLNWPCFFVARKIFLAFAGEKLAETVTELLSLVCQRVPNVLDRRTLVLDRNSVPFFWDKTKIQGQKMRASLRTGLIL